VVGVATEERQLVLADDGRRADQPVDMPMDVLLGKPPKMHRDVKRGARLHALNLTGVSLQEAVIDVLATPPWPASASSSPSATAPWAA
jgi:phosphoribosylformylglycinamidine synthase